MTDIPWEHADEARAALNAIVTDPEHGVAALSSPRTMANLLKDLLPDAPREKNLLVAAAEAGLADTLREHVSQGMDSSTAIRLAASSFSARSPLTPDACSWVTGEIAVALGISETNEAAVGTASQPGPAPFGAATEVSPVASYPPGQGGSAGQGGWAGQGYSADQPGRTFAQEGLAGFGGLGGAPGGGVAGAQGGFSRAPDSAAPAGGYQGSAVVSPGQGPPSSYPSSARPSHPQGQASQPQGQAGYQQGAGGYSSASPGYAPPTAYAPAQNPQAYGPGVTPGMPAMPGYHPIAQPGIRRRTNTMAVTSLVLGLIQLVGWLIILPGLLAAILAIVLGFVSMRQISRSGEAGKGLAITGVILGFLGILAVVILVIVGVASSSQS